MQPNIYITDNGPHPSSTWAEMTVDDILSIKSDSETDLAKAGRRLELMLLDVFEAWYDDVLAEERKQIAADGDAYLKAPVNGAEHDTTSLVADVVIAAKGTPFEAHFARPDVADRLRTVVASHVAVLQDAESSWHADRNASTSPVAAVWKANHADLGIMNSHLSVADDKGDE